MPTGIGLRVKRRLRLPDQDFGNQQVLVWRPGGPQCRSTDDPAVGMMLDAAVDRFPRGRQCTLRLVAGASAADPLRGLGSKAALTAAPGAAVA